MPLNFFSPHAQYASTRDDDGQHLEFKDMVKALHQAGIAVVLDVVYNHTCEGDHRGPIYSFKGFGGAGYYMPSSEPDSSLRQLLGHGQYAELQSAARAENGHGQPAVLEKRNAH